MDKNSSGYTLTELLLAVLLIICVVLGSYHPKLTPEQRATSESVTSLLKSANVGDLVVYESGPYGEQDFVCLLIKKVDEQGQFEDACDRLPDHRRMDVNRRALAVKHIVRVGDPDYQKTVFAAAFGDRPMPAQ